MPISRTPRAASKSTSPDDRARKPVGQIGSPRYARDYRIPAGVLGLGVLLGVAFPLGGLAIATFAIIDFFLPKRLKEAGSH